MEKIYIVIHEDSGQEVRAWFPDFPSLTVLGDRLSDTLTTAPLVLQQHLDEMKQRGEQPPLPSTPSLWKVYVAHPTALIGFVRVTLNSE